MSAERAAPRAKTVAAGLLLAAQPQRAIGQRLAVHLPGQQHGFRREVGIDLGQRHNDGISIPGRDSQDALNPFTAPHGIQ